MLSANLAKLRTKDEHRSLVISPCVLIKPNNRERIPPKNLSMCVALPLASLTQSNHPCDCYKKHAKSQYHNGNNTALPWAVNYAFH